LVVDDEPDLSDLAKAMLELSGDIKVRTATSAKEAREELARGRYDAIVSDYQMPRENGIEFLHGLRSSGVHIPFILFTGKGREDVVIEAIDKGADSYMQKGGETRSVFAELSHKIRGAVSRARAEEALRESESHYRSLIDGSPVGLLLTDRDGNCIYANRKWLEMATLTLDEAKGKGWQGRICAEEKEEVMKRWRRSLESEGVNSFEYRILDSKHEEIWFLANAAPIYSIDGSPTTFVTTNIDITARRRAEEELIALKEMLEISESISKVGGWK
jgi:PAS domain S-box-containing protein